MSTGGLEVQTERDEAIGVLGTSYSGIVLRVKCRRPGERRWRRFLLVPDEGEGYEELEANAREAAELYLAPRA